MTVEHTKTACKHLQAASSNGFQSVAKLVAMKGAKDAPKIPAKLNVKAEPV
jgi:hypothetical protein